VARVVILFVVIGQMPIILVLALVILCYLTAIELKPEADPFLVKAWWVLLVFLTNLVGYVAFRIWLALRRRRSSA
jgi:hypothetical protein